jgi:hypothetical protein
MAEDASFFRHQDSRPRRSAGACGEPGAGGFVLGASTLSQQLAKNLFLSRAKTQARKIQEALLTWQLEKTLTKERILELYLNIIEWGPEVFGLREAAGHYFGKRPEELTPMETALLVAMIPGPRLFHEQLLKQGRPPALYRNRAEALVRELGRQKVLTPETGRNRPGGGSPPSRRVEYWPIPRRSSSEGLGYEPSPMPPPPNPSDTGGIVPVAPDHSRGSSSRNCTSSNRGAPSHRNRSFQARLPPQQFPAASGWKAFSTGSPGPSGPSPSAARSAAREPASSPPPRDGQAFLENPSALRVRPGGSLG